MYTKQQTPIERKKCNCACHENKLKTKYAHDMKCCKEMNGYIVDEPDFIKVRETKLHKGCCEVLGCPIHKRIGKKEETPNVLGSINLSAEDVIQNTVREIQARCNLLNTDELKEIYEIVNEALTSQKQEIRKMIERMKETTYMQKYPNEWYDCCGAGENSGYEQALSDLLSSDLLKEDNK
jgi:hypothetical protein